MCKKFNKKLDKVMEEYGIFLIRSKRNRIYKGEVNGQVISVTCGRTTKPPMMNKVLRQFKKELTKVGITNTKSIDNF